MTAEIIDAAPPLLTVAICTHNRAASLGWTLQSLCEQQGVEATAWDVIVVANACTDGTIALVRGYADRLRIRVVEEGRMGLSHARNAALAAAGGELVVFTDDDVLVDAHWVSAYVRGGRDHPEASFFGGRIAPDFPDGRPPWLTDPMIRQEFSGICLNRDLGGVAMKTTSQADLPFGANFGVRRSHVGGRRFDPRLGVVGQRRLAHEETIFLDGLLREGRHGYYLPQALVHHPIGRDRLTAGFIVRYAWGSGIADVFAGFQPATCQVGRRWWTDGRTRWIVRQALRQQLGGALRAGWGGWCLFLYRTAEQLGRIAGAYEMSRQGLGPGAAAG